MSAEDVDLLPIGTVASRSGVNASALRFYESLGLIESVRGTSGRRFYPRATLRRIAFIVFAQRVGFQLEEIAAQLRSLQGKLGPNKDDWSVLWDVWARRLDERIAQLTSLRESLDLCIGCGCLSLKHCRIYNREDCMASNGPGPRKWLGDEMKPVAVTKRRR